MILSSDRTLVDLDSGSSEITQETPYPLYFFPSCGTRTAHDFSEHPANRISILRTSLRFYLEGVEIGTIVLSFFLRPMAVVGTAAFRPFSRFLAPILRISSVGVLRGDFSLPPPLPVYTLRTLWSARVLIRARCQFGQNGKYDVSHVGSNIHRYRSHWR